MPRFCCTSRVLSVWLCLCLGGALTYAMPVRHSQKKEARQEISDLEKQWRTATMKGDLVLLDKLLSDDFVGISTSGQVNTKAMQMERIRRRTLNITKLDITDEKIKLVGTVAIVTSRAEIDGVNDGVDMHGVYRYIRVYQRLPNGTWKITNFEATRVPQPRAETTSQMAPNEPAPPPPAAASAPAPPASPRP